VIIHDHENPLTPATVKNVKRKREEERDQFQVQNEYMEPF
jgi:hypothetical protein